MTRRERQIRCTATACAGHQTQPADRVEEIAWSGTGLFGEPVLSVVPAVIMPAMPTVMAFWHFVALEHTVTITVHCLEHGDQAGVELILADAAILIAVEPCEPLGVVAQQLFLAESAVLVGIKFQRVDLAVMAKPLVSGKAGGCRKAGDQTTGNNKRTGDNGCFADFFHGKSCSMRLEDAGDIGNQGGKVGEGAVGHRCRRLRWMPKEAQKGRRHGDFRKSCRMRPGLCMSGPGEMR